MTTSGTSIRFSEEDKRLIKTLRRKIGVSASSEVLRMALRVLAEQWGVKI